MSTTYKHMAQEVNSNQGVKSSFIPSRIQPKLKIGAPNDKYEQEADRMADKVVYGNNQVQQNAYTGSIVQRKCTECEEEGLQMKPLSKQTTPLIQTKSEASGQVASNSVNRGIQSAKGGGNSMDSSTQNFLENSFGSDFSNVNIHTNTKAAGLNQQINARAFTVGNDIFFNKNEYQPNSNRGKHLLAHELAHTIQQGGVRMKIQKSDDYATIRLWEMSFLRNSANSADLMRNGENRLFFRNNQDLNLLSSNGEWVQVSGEAFYGNDISVGNQTGWVRKSWTNLVSNSSSVNENNAIAQDLDDFLDQYLIPALSTWRVAIRTSGNAYLTAYTNYQDALTLADQQAQARADFYAAVLTVVGVGALGWLGDVAQAGESFSGLLRSEAVRGSLEDAIQTGVGEGIDIAQGNWFGSHINRETHPLRYLNGQLLQMDALEAELTSHIGETKSAIRRSSTAFDRASVLVEIFDWWNEARVKNTPNSRASHESGMARVFETGFWIKYIKTVLTDSAYYVFYGSGYDYNTPEDAVIARFNELGMMRLAGIEEWDGWPYQGFGTDYEGEDETPYLGSDATSEIAQWARGYTLPTFD